MPEHSLNRIDWNLLMLAAAKGQRLQPAQMQKVLFLFGEGAPDAVERSYYSFRPYNYGAFDAAVYWDAEELVSQGFATMSRAGRSGWKEFAVTPAGIARAAVIVEQADPQAVDYLHRLVDWACSLSFNDLVRAVYEAHPKTKANSIFKDKA